MKNYVSSLILAIGIALAGTMVYLGIHEFSSRDRTVTVKGLSTREVQADHVVWPLSFSVEGNDLSELQRSLADVRATVEEYLVSRGFSADEFSIGNISVSNNWANYYGNRPEHHYTLSTSLVVSTDKVDTVVACQGFQSEMLSRGVILNTYDWSIDYQYNGLPLLKPEMIEEATVNARAVAQKFADDSGSRIGGIRHASQGQFTVESDDNKPWIKHVRVVTTIDYSLK